MLARDGDGVSDISHSLDQPVGIVKPSLIRLAARVELAESPASLAGASSSSVAVEAFDN
jgi:hypothetical protein